MSRSAKPIAAPLPLSFALLSIAVTTACHDEPIQAQPPIEQRVPDDYVGPIDPEWPPSHPADLMVELKISQLLLARLASGGAVEPPKGVPMIPGDSAGVYAEEGHIGDFDYIEVILGPMSHPDEAMPLVVLLHGRGGRPSIPRGPFHSNKPIRLFIPRGPDPLKSGYNWLATYTNSGDEELLARSLTARVDQLAPAIVAFQELNRTVGKPVLMGFSQGAILTYGLATRYPTRFSAAFPIAGWLPSSVTPTQKQSADHTYPYIHALHGGADTIVPTILDRQTVDRLKALGLRVDYTEMGGVGHTVSAEMNLLVRAFVRTAIYPEEYPAPSGWP